MRLRSARASRVMEAPNVRWRAGSITPARKWDGYQRLEDQMQLLSKRLFGLAVAAPMLFAAGCATQSDLDALRDEVNAVREIAVSAREEARAASAEAKAASAEARAAREEARAASAAAQAANEKADRMFRQSLTK